MTGEQKEIMEIIKPYADKTLNEGCLMTTDWRIFTLVKSDIESAIEELQSELSDLKIIWHYDITAVLKYIKDINRTIAVVLLSWDWKNWYFLDYHHKSNYPTWWFNYKIPNKPLHLYTKKENAELLSLLNKLWQTN